MSENVSYKGFSGYQNMLIQMNTDLNQVAQVCETLKLEETRKAVLETAEHLRNNIFSVGVVGEFKRGKSTVINALLGQDILPRDIKPCSASLNRVTYDMKPHAEIIFKNGEKKAVPVEEIEDYVTKLTEKSRKLSATVQEARLYYPCAYCRNGVEIIDTPGLNDDDNMTAITFSVLPQLDASIMVISPLSPFSQYEEDFLRSRLLTSDLGRVMFVINMMDLIDEEDQEKSIEYLRERITENVLGKVKATYGEGSKEYMECQKKVGDIHLYPVSAKMALRGKLKDDRRKIEESGYPAFEKGLEEFLTEERGAIVLQVPVNRLKSAIVEITKSIQMRTDALAMDHQEFEARNRETQARIEELRSQKKQELKNISQSAKRASYDIEPEIAAFWERMQEAIVSYVEGMEIMEEDLTRERLDDTQKACMESIETKYKLLLQQQFETIQTRINEMLGDEMLRLGDYEGKFGATMEQIGVTFKTNTEEGGSGGIFGGVMLDVVTAAASNMVFGLGGIVSGFQEQGVKGAVTGGIAGLGAGLAVEAVLAAVAMPITWPMVIGIGLISSFAGRGAVRAIFGSKTPQTSVVTVDQFRSALRDSALSMVEGQKSSRDLERLVDQQINSGFAAIKEKLETETENVLRDTEKTLGDIREQFLQRNMEADQTRRELGELAKKVQAVAEHVKDVDSQINAVLLGR
ncbi:dynamin family protein [Enterocloster lavalensis]|uniref:dynamin family protein n=1 Tax=Enterocloster lavalensis TaxID=460384 RepID=UPI0023F18043|nr:dynamin family protein [Enterocloster lavalensis]